MGSIVLTGYFLSIIGNSINKLELNTKKKNKMKLIFVHPFQGFDPNTNTNPHQISVLPFSILRSPSPIVSSDLSTPPFSIIRSQYSSLQYPQISVLPLQYPQISVWDDSSINQHSPVGKLLGNECISREDN